MIERHNLTFLELDTPNHNGRIYPKDEVQKAITAYQAKIVSGTAFGGFADDVKGLGPIGIGDITHLVTKVEIVDDFVIGSIKTISTAKGKQLENIIDDPDTHFGVRGSGQLDSNGVVTNFTFHSVNVFFYPNHKVRKYKPTDVVSDYDRAMGIIKQ